MINVNRVFGHVCHFQLLHETEEMVLSDVVWKKGQGVQWLYTVTWGFKLKLFTTENCQPQQLSSLTGGGMMKKRGAAHNKVHQDSSEWSDFAEALRSTGEDEASRDIDGSHLYMNFTTENHSAVKTKIKQLKYWMSICACTIWQSRCIYTYVVEAD